MAIRTIFMDFYGTLARENDGLIRDLCRKVCETSPHTVQPPDVARFWWERTNHYCQACSGAQFQLFADIERQVVQDVAERYESTLGVDEVLEEIFLSWQKPDSWADARLFLAQLPVRLCVVANADHAVVDRALRHLRFDVPNLYLSEDATCYKPELGIFHKAMSHMGAEPKESLFVGDSLYYDIAPAHMAGMFTAWLNRSGRPLSGEAKPDTTLGSLMQLKNMMR